MENNYNKQASDHIVNLAFDATSDSSDKLTDLYEDISDSNYRDALITISEIRVILSNLEKVILIDSEHKAATEKKQQKTKNKRNEAN